MGKRSWLTVIKKDDKKTAEKIAEARPIAIPTIIDAEGLRAKILDRLVAKETPQEVVDFVAGTWRAIEPAVMTSLMEYVPPATENAERYQTFLALFVPFLLVNLYKDLEANPKISAYLPALLSAIRS